MNYLFFLKLYHIALLRTRWRYAVGIEHKINAKAKNN